MIRYTIAALFLACVASTLAAQAGIPPPPSAPTPPAPPSVSPAPSPTPGQADPRVTSALDQLGLRYKVGDGKVGVLFNSAGGRTHFVYVVSQTIRVETYESRKVWAFCFKSAEVCPTDDVLRKLMIANGETKLGAWQVLTEGTGCDVVFCVDMPANCSPQELLSVMKAVAATTDNMEQALTGEDDF